VGSIGEVKMKLKRPARSMRNALRYIVPRKITLETNPPIYAWLWWNFWGASYWKSTKGGR